MKIKLKVKRQVRGLIQKVGEIVELPEQAAKDLIKCGQAEGLPVKKDK